MASHIIPPTLRAKHFLPTPHFDSNRTLSRWNFSPFASIVWVMADCVDSGKQNGLRSRCAAQFE